MSGVRAARNRLYQKVLDLAEAPLTRRWVQRVGRGLARLHRWRATR